MKMFLLIGTREIVLATFMCKLYISGGTNAVHVNNFVTP